MDHFKNTAMAMQNHFNDMVIGVNQLFVVNISGDDLWNEYLNSFPEGTNRVFRMRREFDCSACRHFVKQFGNVIALKNGVVSTIWDFVSDIPGLDVVLPHMAEVVKARPISDIYVAKDHVVGTGCSRNLTDGGEVEWFSHWAIQIPAHLMDRHRSMTISEIKGEYRDDATVFYRSMNEISMDAILSVLELIASNNLYRGQEWLNPLNKLKEYKTKFDALDSETAKKNFAWENAMEAGKSVSRIRNHSMGTLLTDITSGRPLDAAVNAFEQMVAPANYKRPKAIFTQKMLEDAKKKLEELGYLSALNREFATERNISAENVLFMDRNHAKNVQNQDIFADMIKDANKAAKNFDRVQRISVADFVKNVIPTASSIEAYVENRHAPNFVSLIAPKDWTAPSMFKWNNPFSWAYAGNVTDSMKENVKKAGGKVDGVLRFSIQWNDIEGQWDQNDLDAHCVTPHKRLIFFGDKEDYETRGKLDVDIIHPIHNTPAVENITWASLSRMNSGDYKFSVHCYSGRGGRSGFVAEIEFDGTIYHFSHRTPMKDDEKVDVATVHFDGTKFSITPAKGMEMSSAQDHRVIWNVPTNDFVPVSMVMLSPNYWTQPGVGNKHFFFMLKDCVNDQEPNGFYNEFLKPELDAYRHVMEAIGSKVHVNSSDCQLSGLGFSETQRNSLVVRVTGATKQIMRIDF